MSTLHEQTGSGGDPSRIREHIRTNVIGYIALFLVLTGGSAYALSGSNTVFSDDIVNGEVKNPDIAANAVGTGKIVDGGVNGLDIGDGSIGSVDIGSGAVRSAEVANSSLGGVDISDGSLGSLDIGSGAVRNAELASNSVGQSKMLNGSVGTNEIVNGSVRPADIATRPAARVWRNSNQSMPGSSDTNVSFNVEIYDTANLFDPGSPGQLRAPIDGLYYVQGSAQVVGDSPWNVGLATGGTYVANTTVDGPVGGAFFGNVSTLLRMNAGSTVNLRLRNGSGSARDVRTNNQVSPILSMHWLGPL